MTCCFVNQNNGKNRCLGQRRQGAFLYKLLELSPLAIRQRTGNQTAGQCNEGEKSDDQSDSLVRPAEIVTDVRPDQRQDRADAKKSKESRPDQRPEAGTQATARPH